MSDDGPQLKAFVIGPIGDRDDPDGSPRRVAYEEAIQVFEEVIVPACNAVGLDAERADQIARSGEIPEQIFRRLRDSSVVIADLTGANPNVMYELGLRHTTGKLTFQVGERERLPFDVAAIRTIVFKRSESGLVQARRQLIRALAEGLESGGDPVSATRVWFEQSLEAPDEPAIALDEDSDEGESGFLEKLADMELGVQSLAQAIETATTITEEVSRILREGTATTQAAHASSTPASVKLTIANRVAALLEDPATRLRIAAGDYSQSVERIEPGMTYVLTRLANEPDERAAAPMFPSQIKGLVNAAEESIENTLEFKEAALRMGSAARSLRQAGTRIAAGLETFANVSKRVARWRDLIDRIPPSE